MGKFSSMWDRSKFPTKGTKDMEEPVQLKHDCEALFASALKCREEVEDGKTIKAYSVGKTRSYFRLGALEYLEANRTKEMGTQAEAVQRYIRGWLIRRLTQMAENRRRKGIVKVQKWYREATKKIAQNVDDKKHAKERKAKIERERIAREKAEKKAKAACDARVAKEGKEREAREKAEAEK